MKTKKLKRLEDLGLCPYIKECASSDYGSFLSCRDESYSDCSVYLCRVEEEIKKLADKR